MLKVAKWFALVVGVSVLSYFLFQFWSFITVFVPTYDKQDLIVNYETRRDEITEVSTYINSIVPVGVEVDIEFDGSDHLEIFHVVVDGNWDSNWDVEPGSEKADSLLSKLNWTEETLEELYDKLDDANCISVRSGEPCTIGFQRSGMGKYFYNLFNACPSDSLEMNYNDGCSYIYYKENVVLGYGGGAIGRQCFE